MVRLCFLASTPQLSATNPSCSDMSVDVLRCFISDAFEYEIYQF